MSGIFQHGNSLPGDQNWTHRKDKREEHRPSQSHQGRGGGVGGKYNQKKTHKKAPQSIKNDETQLEKKKRMYDLSRLEGKGEVRIRGGKGYINVEVSACFKLEERRDRGGPSKKGSFLKRGKA